MAPLIAYYAHEHSKAGVPVSTEAEIDTLLDRVKAESRTQWPILIQMYADPMSSSPELSVGIDGDHGVLSYGASTGPAFWRSLGDEEDTDEPDLYYYMDSDTEFDRSSRISFDTIRTAVMQFLADPSEPPTVVRWHKER